MSRPTHGGHRRAGQPRPPRGSGRGRIAARSLAALLLLATAACNGDAGRDGNRHVLSGGRADGRDHATFVMAAGSDAVEVRTSDLDGDLYRIFTPEDAKVVPVVDLDGDLLTTSLNDATGTGPAVVTAELSNAVRWNIRLEGGAKEENVDLTAGEVARVDFVGGTSRATLSLPPATGVVEVTLSGGADQFRINLGGQAPARVHVGGGAGTVDVAGERHTGVAGGTVLTAGSWNGTGDRYDIDMTAGVSSLVLDRLPVEPSPIRSRSVPATHPDR